MFISKLFSDISFKNILYNLIGSFILAFGIYNIHSITQITEGGVLGLTLLLNYFFNISPAISNFILSAICYILGWKILGKNFLVYSAFSVSSYSIYYFILEHFPRIFPKIVDYPLLSSVVGAVFIGTGAGLCIIGGGANSGDDALAMSLSQKFNVPIERIYLLSDLIILVLSLSYIPLYRILYSLITVVLSGQIIAIISKLHNHYILK